MSKVLTPEAFDTRLDTQLKKKDESLRREPEATPMSKDTLSITDNRTGKSYEVEIKDGTIRALDLRQVMSRTTTSV
jgi:hypothetical protein